MYEELSNALPASSVPPFRPDLAYPDLTYEMLDRLRAYGTVEAVPDRTTLFGRDERQVDMFVIIEGSIEVYTRAEQNHECFLQLLTPRQFSGELDLFNYQRTLTGCRTKGDSVLIRITRPQLQHLMRAEGDIANLIMQATIWRKLRLIEEQKGGVILVGQPNNADYLLLESFFIRNGYPHQTLEAHRDCPVMPSVVLADGRVLQKPAIATLADDLGITELPDPKSVYDVTVVGAGPAGLAAAVYAASEGLSTLVIESIAPGGQAGTSSKIENYLGFPTGISGQRLGHRAHVQALKFGVRFAISRNAISVRPNGGLPMLVLEGGLEVQTRAVVVASGARYRRLDLDNYLRFENQGIYYAATAMESLLCRDHEVIVVGGGNSAGQAAAFLAGVSAHVHLIVRAKSLAKTMSQYLVSRIESSARITLHVNSEIERLDGDEKLEGVSWVDRRTGARTTRPIKNVFVMIGAEPNTGWLFGTLRLDRKGFVVTGESTGFENSRYATSVAGIFAVGDVRSTSVKRVASAVGEGSVVVSDVHRYLADHRDLVAAAPDSALAAIQSASSASHDNEISL
jgi:thioredoxin reductase (NADPH)